MVWVRPATAIPFPEEDAELLKAELKKLGAKSVLEFGPGDSTEMLGTKFISVWQIPQRQSRLWSTIRPWRGPVPLVSPPLWRAQEP